LLLVGLLDGSLNALDPTNGQTLWDFSSGAALVGSHTPHSVIAAPSGTPDFFPGVDGGLYHVNHDQRQLEVCMHSPAQIRSTCVCATEALAPDRCMCLAP
jgi:hypothetical protein